MAKNTFETEIDRRVGRWLREQRLARGATLRDIGEELDMTESGISRAENFGKGLTVGRFVHWCNVLGIDLREEERPPP